MECGGLRLDGFQAGGGFGLGGLESCGFFRGGELAVARRGDFVFIGGTLFVARLHLVGNAFRRDGRLFELAAGRSSSLAMFGEFFGECVCLSDDLGEQLLFVGLLLGQP